MKVERTRANVFTLTATSQELSALIAAARLALGVMESDPRAPQEALEQLARVVRDYDAALARLQKEDGRLGRGLAERFLGAPDASPRMTPTRAPPSATECARRSDRTPA